MSILSDRDIRKAVDAGAIEIDQQGRMEGIGTWRLQPASFEFTLSGRPDSIRLFGRDVVTYDRGRPINHSIIDPENPPPMIIRDWATDPATGRQYVLIMPGEFLLGSFAERLRLVDPTLSACIEGKSSLGRLGLLIHVSARYIDPGWDGELTLEFVNHSPRAIKLWAGMRVGQVRFERLTSPPERLYGDETLGSHYQGSVGTVQAASVAYRALDARFEVEGNGKIRIPLPPSVKR